MPYDTDPAIRYRRYQTRCVPALRSGGQATAAPRHAGMKLPAQTLPVASARPLERRLSAPVALPAALQHAVPPPQVSGWSTQGGVVLSFAPAWVARMALRPQVQVRQHAGRKSPSGCAQVPRPVRPIAGPETGTISMHAEIMRRKGTRSERGFDCADRTRQRWRLIGS